MHPLFKARVFKMAVLAAGVLALASCARYAMVEPKTVVVGDMRVTPTIAWSRIANAVPGDIGVSDFWTVEGPGLHSLIFAAGVADGQPVFKRSDEPEKMPKYRKGMPLDEIASLFEATMTGVMQSSVFRYTSVGPATVLGQPGLRMEFTFTGKDELDRNGLAVATVKGDKLYVITYQGTKLLHFDKYLTEAQAIMASAMVGT